MHTHLLDVPKQQICTKGVYRALYKHILCTHTSSLYTPKQLHNVIVQHLLWCCDALQSHKLLLVERFLLAVEASIKCLS